MHTLLIARRPTQTTVHCEVTHISRKVSQATTNITNNGVKVTKITTAQPSWQHE